jgi:hypothetical protein
MASSPRVTHRTDTRGTVNAQYRGLYELRALKAAHESGIPDYMLHPSGWNGDENDLTGFYAEQIYALADVNFSAPDAIESLAKAINLMQDICRNLSVDPRKAVPYDMARFKRELHEVPERAAARDRGEFPDLSEDDMALYAELGEDPWASHFVIRTPPDNR